MPISIFHVRPGLSICHQQADPSQTSMLSHQGIPQRCFSNSNLGQEYCTALLSVLHWKPGQRDLNGGLSIHSQMKSHSPLPALLSSPHMDDTKLSQLCKHSGHPDQHCRPLSALTRLGGPYCLVLQSFQVGSILPMAIQANKFYKNWSLIGKLCAIVENSKLNKHSHLVEYSWQTQCLDTLRYPTTVR